MRRVAIFPYPEMGHLIPSLKLARGLKSRGHVVSYFGPPDFEEGVRSEGFEFVPVLEELFPKGFIKERATKRGLLALKAMVVHAQEGAQSNPGYCPRTELNEALKRTRPELLLIDALLPDIAVAAHAAAIPSVLLNTQLFCPWEKDSLYAVLLNLPEVVLCPKEFDFPRVQRKTVCHHVEACIDLDRREPDFPWDEIDPQKPLLYCAFGSMSHVFEPTNALIGNIIDAVRVRPKWQVILSVGSHAQPASFGPMPSNVVAVSRAPQLQILSKATLMISHGGFNSVKECIFFGVPMVLFPSFGDTPAVTARVLYHGLGLRGNTRNVTSRQIGSLIDTVALESSFKTRIEQMRKKFVEAETSQRAIQAVEKLLANVQSQIN
jgi:UDP:flavonoid glycosyltransferase YjiC (YdhE family)